MTEDVVGNVTEDATEDVTENVSEVVPDHVTEGLQGLVCRHNSPPAHPHEPSLNEII